MIAQSSKPKKIKIELLENEIKSIIDELSWSRHDLYVYFGYEKIIRKLNKALGIKTYINGKLVK